LDRVQAIAEAYPKAKSFANEIVSTADRLKIDPAWLANVINFESGFSTSIQNRFTKATGLIQFMPSTAARLNTSTDSLKGMNPQQQLVYVEKYFQPFIGRMKSQEDVYMAVFYPVAMGNPDYVFKLSVQAVNPGIKTPRDYTAKANRNAKLTSLNQSTSIAVDKPKPISKKNKKSQGSYIPAIAAASLVTFGIFAILYARNKKPKMVVSK
jgi:hypothetical protein